MLRGLQGRCRTRRLTEAFPRFVPLALTVWHPPPAPPMSSCPHTRPAPLCPTSCHSERASEALGEKRALSPVLRRPVRVSGRICRKPSGPQGGGQSQTARCPKTTGNRGRKVPLSHGKGAVAEVRGGAGGMGTDERQQQNTCSQPCWCTPWERFEQREQVQKKRGQTFLR